MNNPVTYLVESREVSQYFADDSGSPETSQIKDVLRITR